MACEICEVLKSTEKVFEDDKLVAFLSPQPAAEGHMILTTKEHYPILEQVPDETISKVGIVSNQLSVMLFEKLGCAGTNILVNNGGPAGQTEPHFSVHIIPRHENDGVGLSWEARKISDEELDELSAKIAAEPDEQQVVEHNDEPEGEDYLQKSLTRIP